MKIYTIDEKQWFGNISHLVNVSKSEPFHDSQLFLFFIYALILSSQTFLQKIKVELKNSKLIQYTKNTYADKKKEHIEIEGEINFALERFQAYETFIKWIFDINYQTRDIKQIYKKFPIYKNITKQQLDKLNEMVLLPMFNGDYIYVKEKINTPILDCVIWNTMEWIPSYCKTSWLSEFPFPPFKDKNLKKAENGDIITALLLYNKVIFEGQIALDIMSSWYGILDQSLQMVTGLAFPGLGQLIQQNGNILVGGKETVDKAITNTKDFVEAVRDTAADILKAIQDAAAAIAKAAGDAASAANDGFNKLMTGIVILGTGLAAYAIYNAFDQE